MKSVLVTGAGGSIGSEICAQLIRDGVERLVLLSLTESGLYNVERKLRAMQSGAELVPLLGSVCDAGMVSEAIEGGRGVDTVIHAAAHKHVPICERNPVAAVENNVRGTLTLAECAAHASTVETFVLISSDKAVKPQSVMGATKRAAEMMMARYARKHPRVRYCCVRFGNVLNSAGSVMPLWREQILSGGPITLTDERCERFFMSIPEAVDLILSVIRLKMQPGTYVFDMGPPQRLIDIAQQLIVASGTRCEIKVTGLRPGEKLTEELHFGGAIEPTDRDKVLRVIEADTSCAYSMIGDLLQASKCRKADQCLAILREMTA